MKWNELYYAKFAIVHGVVVWLSQVGKCVINELGTVVVVELSWCKSYVDVCIVGWWLLSCCMLIYAVGVWCIVIQSGESLCSWTPCRSKREDSCPGTLCCSKAVRTSVLECHVIQSGESLCSGTPCRSKREDSCPGTLCCSKRWGLCPVFWYHKHVQCCIVVVVWVGWVVDVVDVSLVLSRCRCVVIKNEVGFELNIIGVVLIIKYDAIFICTFLIDVVVVNLLLFQCIWWIIYILLLFVNLTPSAGIAASWASAGSEG